MILLVAGLVLAGVVAIGVTLYRPDHFGAGAYALHVHAYYGRQRFLPT